MVEDNFVHTSETEGWKVDKRIPVIPALLLLFQTVGLIAFGGYWYAILRSDVNRHDEWIKANSALTLKAAAYERWEEKSQDVMDRLARVEEARKSDRELMEKMDTKLDRLNDTLHRR